MPLPLAGVTVLDFTQVVSGALATGLLSDFGADVVKVETATRIDPARRLGPFRPHGPREPDGSMLFASVNRNKRSVTINLKHPQGVEVASALAERVDVVVENFSPGVMSRLGLGPDRLLARNPQLIYMSMSGFGHRGPRAGWVSFNAVLQALSGLMAVTGRRSDPPFMVSNSWADFVAALHGALLILAALVRRQDDGRGIWIDMSQYEANVLPLGHLLLAAQESARAVGRWGNRSPGRVPQGCYRCQGADAWCVISVGDEAQWRALVEVIDDEALRSPNYHSTNVRWRDHDLIDRAIEAWTGAQPALQVEEVLRRADVPAAAVRTNLQVLSEIDRLAPSFRRMPHPLIGEVPIFPNAIHLDGAAPTVTRAGPLLGEDTAAVLHALLGMSAQDVERLRADGALA